mmetsp:Transcript_40675/g.117671  ORF Transcript_40675/g.117671 Transcript_40675/m.117671 type:complete len:233 (-) Transcript_40675:305-1003(-)
MRLRLWPVQRPPSHHQCWRRRPGNAMCIRRRRRRQWPRTQCSPGRTRREATAPCMSRSRPRLPCILRLPRRGAHRPRRAAPLSMAAPQLHTRRSPTQRPPSLAPFLSSGPVPKAMAASLPRTRRRCTPSLSPSALRRSRMTRGSARSARRWHRIRCQCARPGTPCPRHCSPAPPRCRRPSPVAPAPLLAHPRRSPRGPCSGRRFRGWTPWGRMTAWWASGLSPARSWHRRGT